MSEVVLCRICLRADVNTRDIPVVLIELHDEICDYDIFLNKCLKYCAICEHQLRKFHKFRKLCQEANKVLNKWKKNKKTVKAQNLHEQLPVSPLGICNNKAPHRVYEYLNCDPDPDPDLESDLSLIQTENDDKDTTDTFITKEIQDTESVRERRHFEEVLQEVELTDNVEEVVPKDELTDSVEEVLQNDELTDNFEEALENDELTDNVEEVVPKDELTDSVEEVLQNDELKDNVEEVVPKDELTDNLEGALENDELTDNIEEVVPKVELTDSFEEALQNDESIEDLSKQEDYLPLSDENEQNDCSLDFLDDLFDKKKEVATKVKTKSKKVKKLAEVKYEFDDIYLAELIEEYGEDDKLVKARKKFLRNKARLKERILDILDTGQFNDLGNDVKMTKDIFIKIFNRYDKCDARMLPVKPDSSEIPQRLKKFLLYMLRNYNPEYETIFDIEYLDTDKKKLQEFNRRKEGRLYKEAPYKCELCYKGFEAQGLLEYHNKWHKPAPNDIVCNICPMRFVSKSTYKAHRKNNHTVVYTCRQCPVVTYHFSVMMNHYNHHKGVEYHCPICLGVYLNLTTLNNHRRQAHATSYICTTCARSFVSEKGLFYHKKYKHKDEPQADPAAAALCAECNITFDSRAAYETHARTAHSTRMMTEKYKCYYCKERFDSIEALRNHKLDFNHQRAPKYKSVPSGGRSIKRKPFTGIYRKCTECNVEIPNIHPNSLYKHHLKAHPNVAYTQYVDSKDYLCEECGKTFMIYSFFLDHKNEHTGAKPYACKKCPARFATQRYLAFHSERHRPPRYQCKECDKLFLSAANMYSHRRIHIGDRRYKCEICFKGFLYAGSLKAHINGVHNQIRRKRKLPSSDKDLQ